MLPPGEPPHPAPATLARHLAGLLALLATVALVAAHLPLLVAHGRQIWLRPHYRFFPLVLVGAGVLAYTRLRRDGLPLKPGSAWLAGPALLLAWLLLATAEVLYSSWLGSVAVLATLAALGYALGGAPLVRRLWPAWLLLWLAVPPPLELDRDLILWLQGWTTRWSSAVLDTLRVFHLMAGNVVEVDGRQLLVEGACSGVNSLFSVLACALFLMLLAQRPPLRALLLLAAAVGWVLVANVARVVGVAWLASSAGIDVSAGWRHEAFGLALFAAAVALIVSTDQLLSFLLTAGSTARFAAGSRLSEMPASPAAAPATVAPPRIDGVCWPALLAVPAFLLLLGGHGCVYGWDGGGLGETEPALAELDDLDADSLPERLGRWQRLDFQVQTRQSGSFFGESSRVWRYRHGSRLVVLSLDYPFPSWHDLTRCYTGQGWQRDSQEVRQAAEVPGGFVAVRLSKPASRSGYLLFCEFNGAGQPLAARRGAAYLSLFRHGSALVAWQARLGGEGAEGAVDPPGPVYQWQLMAETSAPLGPAEREALREVFARSFTALRRQLLP
jgi:exosortase